MSREFNEAVDQYYEQISGVDQPDTTEWSEPASEAYLTFRKEDEECEVCGEDVLQGGMCSEECELDGS